MNFLLQMLAILLLVFLFDGEPDVWDKLHDKYMRQQDCEVNHE